MFSSELYLRGLAVRYLWSFLARPYTWGGDNPLTGFDCSGLVMEILKAVGLEPRGADKNADMLWKKYGSHETKTLKAGCLVFWFNPEGRATHVEMMFDNEYTIGASGGGSSTTTLAEAARRSAFVKLRPVTYRGTDFKVADPLKAIFNE